MTPIDTAPAPARLGVVEQLREVVSVLSRVSAEISDYRELDEPALLHANLIQAQALRAIQARGAMIAGEIARRSAAELGSTGLAFRSGHRTVEQFLKATTGATGQQAVTAVRIGVLMHDASDAGSVNGNTGEVSVPSQPWLVPVAERVRVGLLSVFAAEAIGKGLGSPNSAVGADQLEVAAEALCAEARGAKADDGGGLASIDPDRLYRRARELRDELDLDGVAIREEERRRQRSLTFVQLPSGLSKLVWTMDLETAAVVKDLYDRATSPKLGGVRFVDEEQKSRAAAIRADDRTPAQLASDAFEQLLRQGADADTRFLLGSGAPVIRVAATRAAVDTRRGLAHIEGQPDAVSIATLERLGCTGTHTESTFDEHEVPLNHGRGRRLYTRSQKEVLALKWGGCVDPGCGRPPSWTETHHIELWQRDYGKTDIADGVLLCRHHHLKYHNEGWEIRRDESARYWLVPPKRHDPEQVPILLRSKSPIMRDLARERLILR